MKPGRGFGRTLRLVTAAHVALVAAVLAVSGWRRWMRPRPTVRIPVELTMPVVAPAPEPRIETVPEPEPRPAPEPVPEPEPPPRRRPRIEPSRTLVTRTPEASPRRTPTEADLRKLLAGQLEPDDDAPFASEDAVCFERVRRAFHGAWAQPSREEAGDAVVRARIEFGGGGVVTGGRLAASSGNATLDASVQQAIRAVTQVDGLTPGFIARHRTVVIAFKVE
jgi:TonB family protein